MKFKEGHNYTKVVYPKVKLGEEVVREVKGRQYMESESIEYF